MADRCVAVVDPYSSGALLADELRARGARCIAIESSPRIPGRLKSGFHSESFVSVIHHNDDIHDTLHAIRSYEPTRIVAGFESGVELTDQLSEALSLPSNGLALSQARRDKYLMWETVRAHGLVTARQFQSSRLDALLEWIERSSGWPVVVKPSRSVASDSVFRCGSPPEVRQAHEAILTRPTVLGDRNEVVLVQELLRGDEYAVDVVSFEGRRKTTAFWRYDRQVGDPAIGYDTMTLLPYAGTRQRALSDYAGGVLDALGIDFGPAHCEIMWTDDGPALVEVGARLSAGVNAVLSRVCGGVCQLDETVDTILDPQRFLDSLDDEPTLDRSAVNVFLMPRQPGRVMRINGLDVLKTLPTLHSMSVGVRPGQLLPRVAGIVTLVSGDMRAIERDIDAIRAVERRGLFDVEAPAGD